MRKGEDLYQPFKWTVMCNGGRHTVELRPSGKIIFHGHPELEMARLFASADEGTDDKYKCFRILDQFKLERYDVKRAKVTGTTIPPAIREIMKLAAAKRHNRHYEKYYSGEDSSRYRTRARDIFENGCYDSGGLLGKAILRLMNTVFKRAYPVMRKDDAIYLHMIGHTGLTADSRVKKCIVSPRSRLNMSVPKNWVSIVKRTGGVAYHRVGATKFVPGMILEETPDGYKVAFNYCNRGDKHFFRIEEWKRDACKIRGSVSNKRQAR